MEGRTAKYGSSADTGHRLICLRITKTTDGFDLLSITTSDGDSIEG